MSNPAGSATLGAGNMPGNANPTATLNGNVNSRSEQDAEHHRWPVHLGICGEHVLAERRGSRRLRDVNLGHVYGRERDAVQRVHKRPRDQNRRDGDDKLLVDARHGHDRRLPQGGNPARQRQLAGRHDGAAELRDRRAEPEQRRQWTRRRRVRRSHTKRHPPDTAPARQWRCGVVSNVRPELVRVVAQRDLRHARRAAARQRSAAPPSRSAA